MKSSIRIFSSFLSLCLLLGVMTFAGIAETESNTVEAEEVSALSTDGIVSDLREFVFSSGMTTCWISNHGSGQTRMCTVSSGTYYALFTGDDPEADPLPWALFRTNADGTVEILYEDFMPYKASGPTYVIMADKNEDIWVYSGWSTDGSSNSELFSVHAYHYDVDKDIVTEYASYLPYHHPGSKASMGGGYSVACIDVERNEIYAAVSLSDKPGYLEWCVFDIATKEWSSMKGAELDYRYCYDYMLPDGNGGFHIITQRDVRVQSIMTDVGLNVYDAAMKYHTHWTHNNMLFDEWDYFHIPNAREDVIELQTPVEAAQYDVMNGMYPDSHMADIFMDSDGLLHFIHNTQENITPGWHTSLVTYDVSNGLKEVQRINFDFLAGPNAAYCARLFQDTTGAFYVIACREGVYNAYIEIWGADSPTGEFSLLWSDALPGHITPGGMQASTSRNGSLMNDTLMLSIYNTIDHDWYEFSVNFVALRQFKTDN